MEDKNHNPAIQVDAVEKLIDYCNKQHNAYPADIIDQIIQEKEVTTPKLLEIATRFVQYPHFMIRKARSGSSGFYHCIF